MTTAKRKKKDRLPALVVSTLVDGGDLRTDLCGWHLHGRPVKGCLLQRDVI